jgi:hypothetical protein
MMHGHMNVKKKKKLSYYKDKSIMLRVITFCSKKCMRQKYNVREKTENFKIKIHDL